MKFILEVDMVRVEGDPGAELGRMLRDCGDAMQDVEVTNGASQAIFDSRHHQVGRWIITDEPDT